MDVLKAGQFMSRMNMQAIKEPRGFIRLLQFVLAILAFATACNNTTRGVLKVLGREYNYDIAYPFQMEKTTTMSINNGTYGFQLYCYGNWGASPQFFVFVGVMAFLYSIFSVVLYVFFDKLYNEKEAIPLADFFISIGYTAFWFISSSAWAHSLRQISRYSDATHLIPRATRVAFCGTDFSACSVLEDPSFTTSIVSVMFGFLNTFVWGAGLWFLFKETKLHKEKQATPAAGSFTPQEVPSVGRV